MPGAFIGLWTARPLEALVPFGAHDAPTEQRRSPETAGRAKYAGFFFRDDLKGKA
jgi:hypothetical protein